MQVGRSLFVLSLLVLVGCDRPVSMSSVLDDAPLVETDTTGLPSLAPAPVFRLTRERLEFDQRAVLGREDRPVATASTVRDNASNAYGGLAKVEALMRANEGACDGGRVALGLAPDVPLVLAARVIYGMSMFCRPDGLDLVVRGPEGLAALPMDLSPGSCVPDDPPRATLGVWVDPSGVRVHPYSTGPSYDLSGLLPDADTPDTRPEPPPWAYRVLVATEGDCLSAPRQADGRNDLASVSRLITAFGREIEIVGATIEGSDETTWTEVADVAEALTRLGIGFSRFTVVPGAGWSLGCEQVYVVGGA